MIEEARIVEEEMDPPPPPPVRKKSEIKELIILTATYWIASVSWVGMKATDTAVLGHVGTKYLEASAYSDLWTSSTGVFLTPSVLGVLCSQAFGAKNYELVTVWLKVSLFVLSMVAIPVGILWLLTGPGLGVFGINGSMRQDAGLYAQILAACIPARIGFNQIAQFFTSQKIMKPEAFAAGLGLILNVIGAVTFAIVLQYGFIACPIVTSSVEYCQLAAILILAYYFGFISKSLCRPHAGWFSMRGVLTKTRIRQYLDLYFPAALALASDFWRLAAIGAVAASLSRRDLGVFNASYRIMWLSLTVAGSLGTAIQVKLGIRLGAQNASEARAGVGLGLKLTVLVLILLAFIVVAIPRQIGQLFSNDKKILDAFQDIRFPLGATVFFMNFAVVLERIPLACGRTRLVFMVGFFASWAGQVPAVLLFITLWQRSLVALFTGVATGYAMLTALLLYIAITTDFDAYAREAALRSEVHQDYTLLDEEGLTQDPPFRRNTQKPSVQVVANTHPDDFDEHDDDDENDFPLPKRTAMQPLGLAEPHTDPSREDEHQLNALLSEVDDAIANTSRGFVRPPSSRRHISDTDESDFV